MYVFIKSRTKCSICKKNPPIFTVTTVDADEGDHASHTTYCESCFERYKGYFEAGQLVVLEEEEVAREEWEALDPSNGGMTAL